MQFGKSTLINAVLSVVIVASAAVGLILWRPWATNASESAGVALTGTVQQGAVSRTITASGQIAAKREVAVSFAASGTVASVKVELGEVVSKGDVIAVLDKTELQEAVTTAQQSYSAAASTLSSAQSALKKAKAGSKVTDPESGATSVIVDQQQVQQAQSQVTSAQERVNSAKQQLKSAKSSLSSATLKAPISGLVVAVNAAEGTVVGGVGGSSTAVVTIADTSAYTVTTAIAEADIAEVDVGQAATVTFPALDDAAVAARVTAIAPTATASNSVVTYATTITLEEVPERLRLGQTAEVEITIESSAADALYVPSAALATGRDGTSTVTVIAADGSESVVTVQTGIVGDQGTEILSGLQAGQSVKLGEYDPSATSAGNSNIPGGGFSGFPGGGNIPSGSIPGGGFPGGGAGGSGNFPSSGSGGFPGGNR